MPAEFDSGVFYKEGAWHGEGNVKQEQDETALATTEAGSLGWTVDKEPLYVKRNVLDSEGNAQETFVPVEGYCANTRQDNLNVLGVVGENRHNVQNLELAQFFWPWVEKGLIEISAFVSLRGGKRICMTAEIKGSAIEIVPGDEIKRYVTIAHGHDTSLAIRFGFTDTRTVCSNTLQVMLQTSDLLKHRHTRNCMVNLEAARDLFDVQRAQMRLQADVFQAMAARSITEAEALAYFREVFHEGAALDEKIVVRHTDRLLELFEAGRGAHFSRGTLWGAFNAITEFATHERGRKETDNAHRFETNLFGQGSVLLGRALQLAQTILAK